MAEEHGYAPGPQDWSLGPGGLLLEGNAAQLVSAFSS